MLIEAGVVAGYAIAWAARKARRVGVGLDVEVDVTIDAGLERLHDAVVAKLAGHPVLFDLAAETAAEDGQVSKLTRRQVELAVAAAAHKDEAFAATVTRMVGELRAAEPADVSPAVADGRTAKFTGAARARAATGGIAFGQVAGDVHVNCRGDDAGRPDPSEPGRSRI